MPAAAEITKSIDDHNRAIDALLLAPEMLPIKIRCKWVECQGMYDRTEHTRELRIVSADDARRVLRNLRTEDRELSVSAHGCGGHMKFCFAFNGQDQVISFDHGVGIMSSLMPRAGFRHLPKEQCRNLIEFLQARGFTKRQMGMNE